MNTLHIRWLMLALCIASFTGQRAYAQSDGLMMIKENVYFQDLCIAPGEDKLVELWIDNSTFWWENLTTVFVLPDGLTLAPLTSEDLTADNYTFESCAVDEDGKRYHALSTIFGNADYLRNGESWLEEVHRMGYAYPMYYVECYPMESNKYYCFNGTKPIVLLKFHADERLADESEIQFTISVFGGYSVDEGYGLGQGTNTSTLVNGTPTTARVRRAQPPTATCDVNGDGVVDVEDVNTVIRATLE